MTSEERFVRIETNLERLEKSLDAFRGEVDTFRVWVEKSQHDHELRIQRLTEFQIVLMESQNDSWRALKTLSDNIEKLIQLRGPNGQGRGPGA